MLKLKKLAFIPDFNVPFSECDTLIYAFSIFPQLSKSPAIIGSLSANTKEIDNKKINSLARYAGCPADKFSGVYLHKKRGDAVKKNEKIITLYADSVSRLRSALAYYKETTPIKIK